MLEENIRKSFVFESLSKAGGAFCSFLKSFFVRSPLAWRLLMVNLLAPALRVAFMESNEVMIEGFLDGTEISRWRRKHLIS